ncbi:ribosomal protein S2 (apicoplast) [Theileria orientalis]|uniref:Ribosomal protein S2 n=1 Tax=Theileria orientalis TaxID=68886 RepID=A0A976SI61_THEOR|nr:ribosomal protein S2 [Theileria orientalis]
MKFLTFDNLFDKNIHINRYKNLKRFDNNLYKILNNSCIIDLTYTSVSLYRLYKIFYILNSSNVYISFIHSFNWNNDEFVNLLLKFTNNNIFNSKYWVKGIITNEEILNNVIILGLWLNKFFVESNKSINIPFYINRIKNKVEYICSNLKFKNFSKFIFIFNFIADKQPLKECLVSNKFIMGLCDLNFDVEILDFFIYSNNINDISITFIIKFIVCACINSHFNQ